MPTTQHWVRLDPLQSPCGHVPAKVLVEVEDGAPVPQFLYCGKLGLADVRLPEGVHLVEEESP